MPEKVELPDDWECRGRPAYLFRRFEFSGYRQTREFLDRLAALSEEVGYYPDISFGTTYANITIHARHGDEIGPEDVSFARRVAELVQTGG